MKVLQGNISYEQVEANITIAGAEEENTFKLMLDHNYILNQIIVKQDITSSYIVYT